MKKGISEEAWDVQRMCINDAWVVYASSHMLKLSLNMSKERDRLKNNWKFPREKGKFLNSIGKHCDFLASPLAFSLTERG